MTPAQLDTAILDTMQQQPRGVLIGDVLRTLEIAGVRIRSDTRRQVQDRLRVLADAGAIRATPKGWMKA